MYLIAHISIKTPEATHRRTRAFSQSSSATVSPIIHPSCCSNGFSWLENTKIKMNFSVCTQDLVNHTISKSRKMCNDRAIGMGYVRGWGLGCRRAPEGRFGGAVH